VFKRAIALFIILVPLPLIKGKGIKGIGLLKTFISSPFFRRSKYSKESLRGAKPLLYNYFPLMQGIHLPIMERGIQGVR